MQEAQEVFKDLRKRLAVCCRCQLLGFWRKCAGCNTADYCSMECKRSDWFITDSAPQKSQECMRAGGRPLSYHPVHEEACLGLLFFATAKHLTSSGLHDCAFVSHSLTS